MEVSKTGIQFLIKEEGVKLSSYLDVAGVWTIGTGFTYYPTGKRVKQGDEITVEQNELFLKLLLWRFEKNLNDQLTTPITQNQFDALLSLSYNIGMSGFNRSSVLKAVNDNPNNPDIRRLFELWRFATINGKKEPVLLNRRKRESNLYFS